MSILQKSYIYAKEKHEGQFRKNGEPYIEHPIRVASIVNTYAVQVGYTDKDLVNDMSAAAYLHDVLEDCDVKMSELEHTFGVRIAKLVLMLTNYSALRDKDNWPEFGGERPKRYWRKRFDCSKLKVISEEAKLIKLADITDNLNSLKSLDSKKEKGFIKMTLEEVGEKLDAVETIKNEVIVDRIRKQVKCM